MIHLVTGKQGSGKTLFLVKCAYEGYLKKKKVYSNIDLNFPYKPMDYNDIIKCKYDNAIVLIDEIHQLLPSRKSMSRINREICDSFLSMVRKKNLEVYGTTQTFRKVDVRFREEADFNYICSKHALIKNKYVDVITTDNLPLDIPIFVKMFIQESYSGDVTKLSFYGNELFPLYNTKQVIQIKNLKII